MATTIYSEQRSYGDWVFLTKTVKEFASSRIYRYPYPQFGAVRKGYLNRVWDSVEGDYVSWVTDYPDVGGLRYKGAGRFGVDTSDYKVETVVFGREQR